MRIALLLSSCCMRVAVAVNIVADDAPAQLVVPPTKDGGLYLLQSISPSRLS